VAAVNLDAGVPAYPADERNTRRKVLMPELMVVQQAPAFGPLLQEIVDAGGNRIRADGREVLIPERVADERVVVRVRPPREAAEGRRDAPDLNVEVVIDPRLHPH